MVLLGRTLAQMRAEQEGLCQTLNQGGLVDAVRDALGLPEILKALARSDEATLRLEADELQKELQDTLEVIEEHHRADVRQTLRTLLGHKPLPIGKQFEASFVEWAYPDCPPFPEDRPTLAKLGRLIALLILADELSEQSREPATSPPGANSS